MVAIDDVQIYYEIYGSGAPLLLLHGGLGYVEQWENQIPAFAETYQVIAMDSRGHGRSTLTAKPLDYHLMALDVVALLDHLGIEQVDVVGFSDGGNIGLDLAINHPDRVGKIVAYGANYSADGVKPSVDTDPKLGAYFESTAVAYQKLSAEPERWDEFLGNVLNMWGHDVHFTPEQLGTISTPILVLDGDNDEAIKTEHTEEMASLIPTATLHLLPGTGHFAMTEKAEEFNQVVLDYLSGE